MPSRLCGVCQARECNARHGSLRAGPMACWCYPGPQIQHLVAFDGRLAPVLASNCVAGDCNCTMRRSSWTEGSLRYPVPVGCKLQRRTVVGPCSASASDRELHDGPYLVQKCTVIITARSIALEASTGHKLQRTSLLRLCRGIIESRGRFVALRSPLRAPSGCSGRASLTRAHYARELASWGADPCPGCLILPGITIRTSVRANLREDDDSRLIASSRDVSTAH